MSAILDETNNVIDPESEVRKLQDLVKKLERQNQILRSKNDPKETGTRTDSVSSDDRSDQTISKHNRTRVGDTSNLKEGLKNATLEDVELLDIDRNVNEEEEDTWLYTSPKRPSPAQRNISPYKWVRHEFEHPSPDIESTRKSLVYKLDEVSRVSRSSSSGTLGSLTSPSSTPVLTRDIKQSVQLQSDGMPFIRKPLVAGLGTRVDTNTFTRPKKKGEKKLARMVYEDPQPPKTVHVPAEEESEDVNDNVEGTEGSCDEDVSDAPKLADVVDVQVLARMQEESLRQSFSSPLTSPRKSEVYQATRRSSNSLASASSHSSNSSPPGSPYGSQYLDTRQSGYDSPPTRIAAPNRRARTPGSGARQASPGRTISPARSGIPTPRASGIPRPGSYSKLPTPKKSGIPSGRGRNMRTSDESWKEGCY